MKRTARPPADIPEPRTVVLPPQDYQPSKAELEKECDMPGMSDEELRRAFFRPIRVVRQTLGSEWFSARL